VSRRTRVKDTARIGVRSGHLDTPWCYVRRRGSAVVLRGIGFMGALRTGPGRAKPRLARGGPALAACTRRRPGKRAWRRHRRGVAGRADCRGVVARPSRLPRTTTGPCTGSPGASMRISTAIFRRARPHRVARRNARRHDHPPGARAAAPLPPGAGCACHGPSRMSRTSTRPTPVVAPKPLRMAV
jgi:hypothetical protein